MVESRGHIRMLVCAALCVLVAACALGGMPGLAGALDAADARGAAGTSVDSAAHDGTTNVRVFSTGSESAASSDGQATQSAAVASTTAPASSPFTAWKRVWGQSALDTMEAIAQEGWSGSDTVVIATNATYPDALAASSLAGRYRAPVLLTGKRSLSAQTRNEIARLKPRVAYIVGGPKAIDSSVDAQVKAAGCSEVVRVWGQRAQDTAIAIADALGSAKSDTCFIATDKGFQDALSASPYAYATRSAIYLTSERGTQLDAKTLSAIVGGGYKKVVIVGGPSAVAKMVETQLRLSGKNNIERLWGQNAEGTSSEVAAWSLTHGMGANKVGVATSLRFEDALTGAALCGKNNAPIVLASSTNRSVTYSFINKHRTKIKMGYLFGGTSAITSDTAAIVQDGSMPAVYENLNGYNTAGFTQVGIDVSSWQRAIDWQKVNKAGVDFAILRVGYGENVKVQDDRYFLQNAKGAKEAGIPIGVYIYSYATTTKGAANEAQHMLRLLKEAGLAKNDVPYGVFYDLEEGKLEKTSNRSLLLNMSKVFCSAIAEAGYKPGIYANLNWWNNYLPSAEYNQWTRWIAQYNTKCSYLGSYRMWQFSSTGKVDGITGDVDMNLYY